MGTHGGPTGAEPWVRGHIPVSQNSGAGTAYDISPEVVGTSTRPRTEVRYADAPFGVAYLVAVLYP